MMTHPMHQMALAETRRRQLQAEADAYRLRRLARRARNERRRNSDVA